MCAMGPEASSLFMVVAVPFFQGGFLLPNCVQDVSYGSTSTNIPDCCRIATMELTHGKKPIGDIFEVRRPLARSGSLVKRRAPLWRNKQARIRQRCDFSSDWAAEK
jgi:hypothetical protein